MIAGDSTVRTASAAHGLDDLHRARRLVDLRPRRGGVGRVRQSAGPLDGGGRGGTVQPVHLATPSSTRSRLRARSAAARAGRRRMSSSKTRAGAWSPPPPAISRAIARANTCSITPGPTPTSAPAGATIPNSRSLPRSRRSPGGGSWSRPTRRQGARDALIGSLRELRKQTKTSSIHVTFPTAEDAERLSEAGFLIRTGEQFHFSLPRLSLVSRISSRRSRRASARRSNASGAMRSLGDVAIEWVTGSSIRSEHWDAFFKFYMHTGSRKWGRPYLTRAFFDQIGATLADRVLLVMARRAGPLHRRRDQFHRRRRALRPQLGRDRAPAVPSFRGLLLPGDRLRASPRIAAGRGRRPGRAQARARLPPGAHLFGA